MGKSMRNLEKILGNLGEILMKSGEKAMRNLEKILGNLWDLLMKSGGNI